MRIGINAFYLGAVTTGSGQYTNHLIRQLTRLGGENKYVLINFKDAGRKTQDTGDAHPASCTLDPVA